MGFSLVSKPYLSCSRPCWCPSRLTRPVFPVLLPMAIEDKPCWTCWWRGPPPHLSLCDDAYRLEALEHRSTALKSFTTAILSGHESPEISLAGCLVLCSMSAILGDTAGMAQPPGWRRSEQAHPPCRRDCALIAMAWRRISNTYEEQMAAADFAYHDILMSVTSDREPLIPWTVLAFRAKSSRRHLFQGWRPTLWH